MGASRLSKLSQAAREYLWLWDHRHGKSIEDLAQREHLSPRRIRFGLARARASEPLTPGATGTTTLPRLTLLFPIGPFVPHSACPHRGAIRVGSVICCAVCHRSGQDHRRAMQRDPRTDPKPEKKPEAPVVSTKTLTRKQKRAIRFADQHKQT